MTTSTDRHAYTIETQTAPYLWHHWANAPTLEELRSEAARLHTQGHAWRIVSTRKLVIARGDMNTRFGLAWIKLARTMHGASIK